MRKCKTGIPTKVRKFAYLTGLALTFLLVAGSFPAAGSTFAKVDIPILRQMSESVVHARVTDIRSERIGRGMIFTYVTLDVTSTLHGRADRQLVVKVPGGTVDGYTIKMEGAPEFQRGSTVVAFIARWDDGTPMVAGYFQGVSKVVRDTLGNLTLQGGAANGLTISGLGRQLAAAGGNR